MTIRKPEQKSISTEKIFCKLVMHGMTLFHNKEYRIHLNIERPVQLLIIMKFENQVYQGKYDPLHYKVKYIPEQNNY